MTFSCPPGCCRCCHCLLTFCICHKTRWLSVHEPRQRQINRPVPAHYSKVGDILQRGSGQKTQPKYENQTQRYGILFSNVYCPHFRHALVLLSIIFDFNHFLFKLQAINWVHAWCGEFAAASTASRSSVRKLVNWKCEQRSRAVEAAAPEAAAVQPTLVRYQLVARLLSRNDNSKANGGAGFFARRRRRRATATKCFLREMYKQLYIVYKF